MTEASISAIGKLNVRTDSTPLNSCKQALLHLPPEISLLWTLHFAFIVDGYQIFLTFEYRVSRASLGSTITSQGADERIFHELSVYLFIHRLTAENDLTPSINIGQLAKLLNTAQHYTFLLDFSKVNTSAANWCSPLHWPHWRRTSESKYRLLLTSLETIMKLLVFTSIYSHRNGSIFE